MGLSIEARESFKQKLGELRQEIDSWRQSRICRGHVPAPIWDAAAELANIGGINPVAAPLGLNYYRLKRRALGNQASAQPANQPRAEPASKAVEFVELQVSPVAQALECSIELVNPQGTTMRLRLVGAGAAELVTLVKSIWQEQR
jgi:hypothetical protein